MTEWGADAIGCNCSTGPVTVLTAVERMAQISRLPLIAMPNAGMPRAVDGRNIYLCSPEYMASLRAKVHQSRGKVCGRLLRAQLPTISGRSSLPCALWGRSRQFFTRRPKFRSPRGRRRRPWRRVPDSAALIASGDFVTMVEIVPPKRDQLREGAGWRAAGRRQRRTHHQHPGLARASARMSAQSLCIQITAADGYGDASALYLPRP